MSTFHKPELADRFRGFLPVVIDVETGGFNAQSDALLEIAAVTVAMDEEGFLYPDRSINCPVIPFENANIEQAALEFTGIDPSDPNREALSEHDALSSIFKMVRKAMKSAGCTRAILVGHNANFDLGFLNAAIERSGIKRSPFHPFCTFDTATLAGLIYGQTVLARACQSADISFSNSEAHSALYDTEKTAELFCGMVNNWKEIGGWEMYGDQG